MSDHIPEEPAAHHPDVYHPDIHTVIACYPENKRVAEQIAAAIRTQHLWVYSHVSKGGMLYLIFCKHPTLEAFMVWEAWDSEQIIRNGC